MELYIYIYIRVLTWFPSKAVFLRPFYFVVRSLTILSPYNFLQLFFSRARKLGASEGRHVSTDVSC